jgi:hypothetical protein
MMCGRLSQEVPSTGLRGDRGYFHFPGGKRELDREAMALVGDDVEHIVTAVAERGGQSHPGGKRGGTTPAAAPAGRPAYR